MNRKVMKVVSILLVALMAVAMLSQSAFAMFEVGGNASVNVESGFFSNDKDTANTFQGFIGTLITLIQVVGMGVAVIMLVVMAIKYISAAPSEKAELKKSITIYVVGAIVLFAASGILQVLKRFAQNNIPADTTAGVSMLVDLAKIYLG